MAKPAQSTRRGRHLQRKLHPSSRHPVPNEVIEAKDDELVFRHLKALQEKNPTSTVCRRPGQGGKLFEVSTSLRVTPVLPVACKRVSATHLLSDSSDHTSTQPGWLLAELAVLAFLNIPFNNSTVHQLISQFTISPFLLTKHDCLLIQFFPSPGLSGGGARPHL